MPDKCGRTCLLHHLSAQFFRDLMRLLLPLGHLFVLVIHLRVNALQPPPERLVDPEIELRPGGFRICIPTATCGKGKVLRQVAYDLCGPLTVAFQL